MWTVSVFCLWFPTDTLNTAFDTKRNTSLEVTESQGPDGLETPQKHLCEASNPGLMGPWSVFLKVHWAEVTSPGALSSSDPSVTGEGRQGRHADCKAKYRFHRSRDFFTGSKERQLRAVLKHLDPGGNRAASLSWSLPLTCGATLGRWPASPGSTSPVVICRVLPPQRRSWEGTERAHREQSVSDSNCSFLHCEAREGWDDTASSHHVTHRV